jgi:pimeloyl-ACP methyl ester carboxylesterase
MMRRSRKWWWVLALIPVLVLGGFVVWAETPSRPMPQATAALASDGDVTVSTDPWLVFRPADQNVNVGLILYPGGRVDARAYAPTAHAIAGAGYLAVVVPMPLNLAFFDPDEASAVMAAHPHVTVWAIGGHSLGGAMAARFAYRNPEAVEGLALWAAYPAASDDLSGRDLAVVSIYGTRDGLATGEKIDASRPLLPPDTRWVAIDGGNHAQFGWYGPQGRDHPAIISRAAQQEQIVAATLDLLRRIEMNGE